MAGKWCRLLARGLNSLVDLSIELLECLYDMVAGVHQSKGHKREQGRNHNVFYDLALEVILSILQYPMVPQVSHDRCAYQEVELIGGHLKVATTPPYMLSDY